MRFVGILALVAACDGGAAAPDAAAPDGEPVSPWGLCEPDFDHAYVASAFEVMPLGQGRDLDDDGDVDNAIGLFAGPLTSALATNIENGFTIVTVLSGLTVLYMPGAGDGDADPENNLTGGPLLVNHNAFDVACEPRAGVPITVTGTSFSGGGPTMNFLNSQAGDVRITRVVIEGTLDEGGDATSFDLFGVWTACGMDRITFPGVGPDPDTLVPALRIVVVSSGLQPDIDHDEDGLETIEVDPETFVVRRCTDGDGTVLESEACACDARIADGYSAAARITLVPAEIVGMY